MPDRGAAEYRWLQPAVRSGGLVITGSRRLARELRIAHEQLQVAEGRGAWPTPAIHFWQDWLARALQESDGPDAPRLLPAAAAAMLWEQQLERYLDAPVISLSGLVRQAVTAWQRLGEWDMGPDAVARTARAAEERVFARAAGAYRARLRRNAWVDTAGLARWARDAISAHRFPLPPSVHHAGFFRMPPVLAQLLDMLGERGVEIAAAPAPAREATPGFASYLDEPAEFRAAGAWARDVLNRHPTARVAVVAADLETRGARCAALLREGLAPGWQLAGREHARAVDVSYGRALADYPAIATALAWLRWSHRPLPSSVLAALLRSPFTGSGDLGGRADLELSLRQLPERAWTAAEAADRLVPAGASGDVAEWATAAGHAAALGRNPRQRLPPSRWAERIDRTLRDIGWPGDAPLDSEDFQLVNRWRELLNEFAGLDMLGGILTLAEAVRRLTGMAGDSVFQPETGAGLVRLLGPLEAAGLAFDAVWIAGLDADRWPPPAHPLALVSRRLQRDAGMPDATPADTLAHAERVFGRLLASSATVRLSHARSEGDTTVAPSPLAAPYGMPEPDNPADPGWHAAGLAGIAPLQPAESDAAPAIVDTETVAGGAYTVQRQTTEPFAAFAYGRLGVRDLARFEPGLAASVRGTIVHDALRVLYRDCPAQADIAGWQGAALRRRLEAALDDALGRHLRHADTVLERLLAIERGRLEDLLRTFIAFDAERPSFAVATVEQRMDWRHAGAAFRLRADRIDRLEDGRLLVIDYKTGVPRPLVGRDGEPADLQVVVYSLTVDAPVAGLALLNLGRRTVVPRAAGDVPWDRVREPPWEQRLAAWQARTLAAVEAIAKGDCRVNLTLATDQSRALNVLSRAEELKRAT